MTTRRSETEEIEQFKAFVSAHGGEVLVPTNPYELVRFRGNGVTSIIYAKQNGTRTFTGEANAAWAAWKGQRPYQIGHPTGRKSGKKLGPIDKAIEARDGAACFYCDQPFTDEAPRTREHLVALVHQGPNHLSNMFHACLPCNREAGHLSAPEKIRLREAKRRPEGVSAIMADAAPAQAVSAPAGRAEAG